MKKYITMFIAILLSSVFIIGIVFASGVLEPINANEATQNSTAEITTEKKADESDLKILTTEMVADKTAVTSFIKKFDVKNLTYEEYITIESYINFLAVHKLTSNEIDQINNLIATGTPMGTIWDIYEFYLTTNDDFSIISKIAAYEERYYGKYWIENAYNNITEKRHGVIERNKSQDYLADYTHSEILYANILSRKGVYTIDEILDKHKNGLTWNEITDIVYSTVSGDKAVGSVKERLEIENYLKNDIFDYDSSPFEVHKFAFFCATNGVKVSDGIVVGDNLSEHYNTVYTKLDECTQTQTSEILKDADIRNQYMNHKEYFEYDSKYSNMALNNGMSEKDIQIFRGKGFSMQEIATASALYSDDPCAMIEHIKSMRGDMLK
ncbi:MAG: hypothetical protein IKJ68_12580 [Clostridia bacterium]|nr:hypothetical protein [Clostridia bacterium]